MLVWLRPPAGLCVQRFMFKAASWLQHRLVELLATQACSAACGSKQCHLAWAADQILAPLAQYSALHDTAHNWHWNRHLQDAAAQEQHWQTKVDALRAQQVLDTEGLQRQEAQLAQLRQQAEEVGLTTALLPWSNLGGMQYACQPFRHS